MTGQTGLNGNFGGLTVADLTHHDHVRVLTQNRAQPAGEGHVDLGVDLGLADARQEVFHRVLNGQDIAAAGIDVAQARVQGGGFTRTGRTGHQNDAVGLEQGFGQPVAHKGRHGQLVQGQLPGRLVEQAQYNPFTVGRGDRGHPDVYGVARQAHGNPAILGQALLGDIQARHNLQARYQHRGELGLGGQDFTQYPINTETHRHPIFKRFQVNIRGALAHRLGQDGIDQADDRGIVIARQQVGSIGQVLGHGRQVVLGPQILGRLLRGAIATLVDLGQAPLKIFGGNFFQAKFGSKVSLQFEQYIEIEPGTIEQGGFGFFLVQHHPMSGGKGKGQTRVGRVLTGAGGLNLLFLRQLR